jgi:hypothetical protein
VADRFKPIAMSQVGFLRVRMKWRATLVVVAVLALILLPVWGSIVARIQSSTFPYPGLQMNFSALAVDRLDGTPTYHNLTVNANFQDLYGYGGKLLLKVDIIVHDSTPVPPIEKFIDINSRQEYVSVGSGASSMVVSAAVYTVLWLPKNVAPGQMIGINSFIGKVENPVSTDAFGKRLPMGSAYLVRTAEGSFYYSLDTHVLELYESNVALTTAGFSTPTPLRSITLVTYNDVASRGITDGLLAGLAVLLAIAGVFYVHHDVDSRRKSRLEGLRNRIRSLSDILEDQYLLGFISRETYMRRQVVLRRLASEIDLETQTRFDNGDNEPAADEEDFPAP